MVSSKDKFIKAIYNYKSANRVFMLYKIKPIKEHI